MKLQIEYHRIEIISGIFRPTRSASQPDAVAPTRRNHSVIAKTAVTSVRGTLNSFAIGTMISRKTVKSKESRVHPSQAAHHASHWSLVGSFHHGTDWPPATLVDIAGLPPPGLIASPVYFRTIDTARMTNGTIRTAARRYRAWYRLRDIILISIPAMRQTVGPSRGSLRGGSCPARARMRQQPSAAMLARDTTGELPMRGASGVRDRRARRL